MATFLLQQAVFWSLKASGNMNVQVKIFSVLQSEHADSERAVSTEPTLVQINLYDVWNRHSFGPWDDDYHHFIYLQVKSQSLLCLLSQTYQLRAVHHLGSSNMLTEHVRNNNRTNDNLSYFSSIR